MGEILILLNISLYEGKCPLSKDCSEIYNVYFLNKSNIWYNFPQEEEVYQDNK